MPVSSRTNTLLTPRLVGRAPFRKIGISIPLTTPPALLPVGRWRARNIPSAVGDNLPVPARSFWQTACTYRPRRINPVQLPPDFRTTILAHRIAVNSSLTCELTKPCRDLPIRTFQNIGFSAESNVKTCPLLLDLTPEVL